MKSSPQHRVMLIAILVIGTVLRFWALDSKPLWMDETITAIFSLGHTLTVPIGQTVPLESLQPLWTWQSASCSAIATAIRQQSTHPPLFFCWLHQWVGGLQGITGLEQRLAWMLRSFPAVIGIVAIVAVYRLNRVAFVPAAGLSAAALMAVSPFAVYLSQEARHYTLPMLLITMAVLGLMIILQDLCIQQKMRPAIWVGWVAVNSVGFYVHYFFGLAIAAQILTLISVSWVYRQRLPRATGWVIAAAIVVIGGLILPLMPQFIEHLQRPATDWLNLNRSSLGTYLDPLLRGLAGLIVMVVMLPVESQPLTIALLCGAIMLAIAMWLTRAVVRGCRWLWHDPTTRLSVLVFGSFLGWMALEELGVIYGLGKDLTLAFRYNFMIYPIVCALIGAGLVAMPYPRWLTEPSGRALEAVRRRSRRTLGLILGVGVLSCGCVLSGWAFQKPFRPQQMVGQLLAGPEQSIVIVQTFQNAQHVAFGLSLAINLAQPSTENRPIYMQFQAVNAGETVQSVPLSQPELLGQPLTLWLVTPFGQPDRLASDVQVQAPKTGQAIQCQGRDRTLQVLGVHYRAYRCEP